MRLRLPQILIAMTLVLVAGVLSVRHLEKQTGGPTVPGIIVLDAPGWGPEDLAEIGRAVGGRAGEVPAGAGLLAPFGGDLVRQLAARGDSTILCISEAGPAVDALGWGDETIWEVSLPPVGSAARAVSTAADFVRAQSTTRSFLVGIQTNPADPSPELIRTLLGASERLPSFRRTSIVVLGRHAPGRRPYLRIDLGDWGYRRRVELDDLLDPGW